MGWDNEYGLLLITLNNILYIIYYDMLYGYYLYNVYQ